MISENHNEPKGIPVLLDEEISLLERLGIWREAGKL
jgi:hypothetical protein